MIYSLNALLNMSFSIVEKNWIVCFFYNAIFSIKHINLIFLLLFESGIMILISCDNDMNDLTRY